MSADHIFTVPGLLNGHLATLRPTVDTAYENTDFTPPDPSAVSTAQVSDVVFNRRTTTAGDVYSISVVSDGVTYPYQTAVVGSEALAVTLARLAGLVLGGAYVASPPTVRITGAVDATPFTATPAVTTSGGAPIAGALPESPVTEIIPAHIGPAWLESYLLPASGYAATLGVGGMRREQGVFQVLVYSPARMGWGVSKAGVVKYLAELFAPGTKLTDSDSGIEITVENLVVSPAIPSSAWYQVPVSVYYRADVPA